MSFSLTLQPYCNGKNVLQRFVIITLFIIAKKFEIPKCSKICDSLGKQKHVHTVDDCETFFLSEKNLCLLIWYCLLDTAM